MTQNPEETIFQKNTNSQKDSSKRSQNSERPISTEDQRRSSELHARSACHLPRQATGSGSSQRRGEDRAGQTPGRHLLMGPPAHGTEFRAISGGGENPAARPPPGLCLPLTPRVSAENPRTPGGSSEMSPERLGTKQATCIPVPRKRHIGKEETLPPGAGRPKVRLWRLLWAAPPPRGHVPQAGVPRGKALLQRRSPGSAAWADVSLNVILCTSEVWKTA